MGFMSSLSNSSRDSKLQSHRTLNISRTFPFVFSFPDNAQRKVSSTYCFIDKDAKVREVKQVDQRHPSGKWQRRSVSSGLFWLSPHLRCFIPFCLLSITAAVSALRAVSVQQAFWALSWTKIRKPDSCPAAYSLMEQWERMIWNQTQPKWFLMAC